jgi:uroporphyrinogen decarboxylase
MDTLTSRERIRMTLSLQEPDRVPVDLGGRVTSIHKIAYLNLVQTLGIEVKQTAIDPFLSVMEIDQQLLDYLGVDTHYIFMRGPEYNIAHKIDDENYINEWGVHVKILGYHSQRISYPLEHASLQDLGNYSWPDPAKPERTSGLKAEAKKLYSETDYALIAAPVSGGIFEFGQHLRGMANFLMDLMLDKPFANALLDHLLDIQIGLWESFLDEVGEYVEMVQLADDFGAQKDLMISPQLFREFYKPRYIRLIQEIRKHTNAKIFFHCDGSIMSLIDDFIEMGVEVLNPLQPTADNMDPAVIKEKFGKQLAFHGGIDNQQLLPYGKPEEVRSTVRKVINSLGPGGGFVLASAHVIEPDMPINNVLAMFDAVREFGYYPLPGNNNEDN